RPYADRNPPESRNQPILGANDGNSGTAALLELARTLDVDKSGLQVWLAFFDAEDRGNLDGWPFSVGASFAAERNLDFVAVIVIDMIGDADQQIYMDANSDPGLSRSLWKLADSMGLSGNFIPQVKYRIIDDHIPFALKGIPSALIIDFDYPYWHTTEDTLDKVSAESLERVGRLLERWLEERAYEAWLTSGKS
ncbi:MAG TPA: M28 family peptidase, partial [Chloroflexi bacterium]|nr:M28 family peptidase [Chloroflexota bacterium]